MEKISVSNFKSFANVDLELKHLNILTGINSSGKSTILQSVLLVRQSFISGLFSNPLKQPSITLGDEYSLVRLGTFQDVFHEKSERNEEIGICINEKEIVFAFRSKKYGESETKSSLLEGEIVPNAQEWAKLSMFSKGFQYLSSERISPIESYPNPADSSSLFLGIKGEFAPFVLENFGNSITVDKSLLHNKTARSDQDTLKWQVNYWLGEISDGIEVSTQPNSTTNRTELIYNYRRKGILEGNRKPQNVGYGVTPILPLLVALLVAKPGDVILMENPENHLHPYGQSCLSQLISKVAELGIQIILETHSDHIINGVLVSCNDYNKNKEGISSENLKIYFFDQTADEMVSDVKVDINGRIVNAPKGFFDQISIDRRKLMGF